MIRLFLVKPVPGHAAVLHWRQQQVRSLTEADGFLKFEWDSLQSIAAGWHPVRVSSEETGTEAGEGEIFVPHITQFIFVSDIDDTIMISHSATILRRLRELFIRNTDTRRVFPDVVEHYRLLSLSGTDPEAPNPFFYVSSSEWNLYEYLAAVFSRAGLPRGVFLLSQVKRWYELLASGRTKHNGKLLRVLRIMQVFPKQQFVFLGDNSQHDPHIYTEIARKYPERVSAIYIRNVRSSAMESTRQLLDSVASLGVAVLQFTESREAIDHSRNIGLIADEVWAGHQEAYGKVPEQL